MDDGAQGYEHCRRGNFRRGRQPRSHKYGAPRFEDTDAFQRSSSFTGRLSYFRQRRKGDHVHHLHPRHQHHREHGKPAGPSEGPSEHTGAHQQQRRPPERGGRQQLHLQLRHGNVSFQGAHRGADGYLHSHSRRGGRGQGCDGPAHTRHEPQGGQTLHQGGLRQHFGESHRVGAVRLHRGRVFRGEPERSHRAH